ncbi:MAG: DUF2975 domain-containing protein [Patescibacteria group bacterium]
MQKSPVLFLQTVTVFIGTLALAFLLWEPHIEGVNANATNFEMYFKDPFLAFVYIGSISFFVALFQIFKVLGYVKENKTFSQQTIQSLRTIRHSALVAIGFVVIGEIFIMLNHGNDDAAGGVFMGLLAIAVAGTAVSIASLFEQIVQNILDTKSKNNLPV